ncbi:MAG: hypothetical protein CMJ08_01090 [Pelagibacterales bacterium]|nr:hypothetical protein [Pelagibacterales bacterium]
MIKKKSILFLVTEDWYFISHRIKLAIFLKKKGYIVHVCCKNTGEFKTITDEGVKCHDIEAKRKSLSTLQLFNEVITFCKCIKKVKPDIVHLISMRPAVVGLLTSLAFKKVKFFVTFTGLGFIFIRDDIKAKTLRFLIKFLFIIISKLKFFKVIVQNKDDYNFFIKKIYFKKNRISIIRGSGIDLKYYKKTNEPKGENIIVGYAGRMLEDKGVHWLIEGFKLAVKENKNLLLLLAGSLDKENPTTISKELFNEINTMKTVKYLGNIKDVRNIWNKSHIGVLLSKREGLPLSLMEAAAVGRPLIATDVPGCREIAINKYNAITLKAGDILSVKNAILKLASDKGLRNKLAKNSRKIVESDMEMKKIFKKYFLIYNN